jgi:DNA-binding transcriptional regulator YiaG
MTDRERDAQEDDEQYWLDKLQHWVEVVPPTNRIGKARMKMGLTQPEMAHLLGVATGTVRKWEKERHHTTAKPMKWPPEQPCRHAEMLVIVKGFLDIDYDEMAAITRVLQKSIFGLRFQTSINSLREGLISE